MSVILISVAEVTNLACLLMGCHTLPEVQLKVTRPHNGSLSVPHLAVTFRGHTHLPPVRHRGYTYHLPVKLIDHTYHPVVSHRGHAQHLLAKPSNNSSNVLLCPPTRPHPHPLVQVTSSFSSRVPHTLPLPKASQGFQVPLPKVRLS